MVTVVAASFGCADSEGCSGGWLGRGGAWIWIALRVRQKTLFVSRGRDRAKALCFGTDGSDARGCRFPLEDAV